MSAFSKNLFSLLSEDGEVRPQPAPVKEDTKPVVEQKPKNDKRSPKAAGAQKRGGDKRRGDKRQGGRPQRGRQFDRHSGTGIADSEKKEKQGWGHPETAEAEAAKDSVNPKDPAAAEEPVTPTEPEEVVKTLDEYLAEKALKSLKVGLPEARKANEGTDDAKWKDTVAFQKTEEPDYLPAKEKTVKKEKTAKAGKVFVDIEQRFQEKPRFQRDQRSGRGDRRGRQSNRRGGRQSNGPAVNIQDDAAFPSLGATTA
ncbi:uncharacterized protein BX664DRAFT_321292 [Halteromyces radiatus]|uniref:uncharacterized protein n=1 Tax=Halteromyces radiatus TaxID=101107 RepID=UPI00221F95DD|nr:uncharacterized protein BX664DRAFT_321292 [Halteromyces radiatus]KAI8099461.1 hypothetical protein BX664DRAFT_321292 [Halteromyces radiatus]